MTAQPATPPAPDETTTLAAAKAIYAAHTRQMDHWCCPWDDLDRQSRQEYLEQARAALTTAGPLLTPAALTGLRAQIRADRDAARQAHRSATVDHLAHDYCRWVGHAEALTTLLRRLDN